ncbi:hypothetical protein P3T76_001304 [Phytophthora citrophthora]|uniref:Uncharacterized protein n=1 Tax=Phytophthora citrophthora TaxID=4793 RepID=A0AAD9GY89_9STRA|nr:hypothetical protein P3T76_001304 [Phytophthora citrophthora]
MSSRAEGSASAEVSDISDDFAGSIARATNDSTVATISTDSEEVFDSNKEENNSWNLGEATATFILNNSDDNTKSLGYSTENVAQGDVVRMTGDIGYQK